MNHRHFLWLGLFIAGPLVAPGCGSHVEGGQGGQGGSGTSISSAASGTTTGTGGSGTTSVSSSASGTTTGTGGSGAGMPCDNGPGDVLAMNRLFIGDTNRDGTPNAQNGWKQYGLNLDGLTSTQTSVDLCQPAAGGSKSSVYPDGNGGIDNSFGKNILPMLLGLVPDISAQTNDAILNGGFTLILKINGIGPDNCIASKLYDGALLGSPPLFDGTDVWPVTPDSLWDPNDIESAKNVFLQSTTLNDFFQSGLEASFALQLVIGGASLRLPISHARFEMQLDPAHAVGTLGTIAGIIETEALVPEFASFAASIDPIFCDPNSPTLKSILNQMRQASDIMKDGTQNPSATCDGISIGVGFDMRQVQIGPIAPAAPPQPDPCGP